MEMPQEFQQPVEESLPEISSQEMEDRIFFTHTRVQVLYWTRDYLNRHPDVDEAPEEALLKQILDDGHSAAFRAWYTSKEGAADIDAYAKTHDLDAIERGTDMSVLMRSFISFMNQRNEVMLPLED